MQHTYKVLIVDSDETILKLLRQLLERSRIQVLTASTVDAAKRLYLGYRQFDIVAVASLAAIPTDVLKPDTTHMERFVRTLVHDGACPHIIAMSGYAAAQQQLMNAGCHVRIDSKSNVLEHILHTLGVRGSSQPPALASGEAAS